MSSSLESKSSESFLWRLFQGLQLWKRNVDPLPSFVTDPSTIQWIQTDFVVFLLSRSSTSIADRIRSVFSNAEIYRSDHENESQCRFKVSTAMESRIPILAVIFDDGPSHRLLRSYLSTIRSNRYKVILFRYDELRSVSPLYYAWFLSLDESRYLIRESRRVLAKCLDECAEFRRRIFSNDFGFYNQDEMMDKETLHLTAKYIGRRRIQSSGIINKNLGKVYRFAVFGFVFSRYSLGLRLLFLDDECRNDLYDQEDDPEIMEYQFSERDKEKEKEEEEESTKTTTLDDANSEFFKRVEGVEGHFETIFKPISSSSKGRRAHISIGTRLRSKPVNVGYDVIKVVKAEVSEPLKDDCYSISGLGILRKVEPELWTLYLNRRFYVRGLFTGYY